MPFEDSHDLLTSKLISALEMDWSDALVFICMYVYTFTGADCTKFGRSMLLTDITMLLTAFSAVIFMALTGPDTILSFTVSPANKEPRLKLLLTVDE